MNQDMTTARKIFVTLVVAAALLAAVPIGVAEAKGTGVIQHIVFKMLVKFGLIDELGVPIPSGGGETLDATLTLGNTYTQAIEQQSGGALTSKTNTGAGQALIVTAGSSTVSGNGGTVDIDSGGGAGSGTGGNASLTAGAGGLTGQGGNSILEGGAGGATSGLGGEARVLGGAGGGGTDGGDVVILAGTGQGAQGGGNVTINGGTGGTGGAGFVSIRGGSPTTGDAGSATMAGGAAGSGGAAGVASVTGGLGDGAGVGGTVSVTAGRGGTTATGGVANLIAGQGGLTSGDGGQVEIIGGAGGGDGQGGNARLVGGAGTLAEAGGSALVLGGAGGPTGRGGSIQLLSGQGGGTSGDSGDVDIDAGTVSSGTTGTVNISPVNASATNIGPAAGGHTVTFNGTTDATIVDGSFSGVGGTFTGQILTQDGTVGDLAFGFASDDDGTGTGIFRILADRMGFVSNGVTLMSLQNGLVVLFAPLNAGGQDVQAVGTVSFNNPADTYMSAAVAGTVTFGTTDGGTEAILVAAGLQSTATAVVATSDGLTTGLIPSNTSVVTTTVATDLNDIATLPAPIVGMIIHVYVGGTGHEVRTVAASNVTINNVDADGTNEAALAANSSYTFECTSVTSWILHGHDNLGAVVTAIVPD